MLRKRYAIWSAAHRLHRSCNPQLLQRKWSMVWVLFCVCALLHAVAYCAIMTILFSLSSGTQQSSGNGWYGRCAHTSSRDTPFIIHYSSVDQPLMEIDSECVDNSVIHCERHTKHKSDHRCSTHQQQQTATPLTAHHRGIHKCPGYSSVYHLSVKIKSYIDLDT